ncbi:GNAT family N-acetyltransferase [Actinoplanes sp. G11-F43]|uniref:GNAT family N-acetyltransferase n=1 Tax=Actinoplanes sp. G11-F43 TaxID=3424130 RepID=UPI003D355228
MRWAEEIADPAVRVLVAVPHGTVAGFVAVRADQLLHFGTAVESWGSGLASRVHQEALDLLPARPRLWVFTENHRARRFYAKHGWEATGGTRPTGFAPHPELMEYVRTTPHRPRPVRPGPPAPGPSAPGRPPG